MRSDCDGNAVPSPMIDAMHIVIAHCDAGAGVAWQSALARHLPQARITLDVGTPDGAGSAPGAAADYAVGWKPPADFFERHGSLQAFFSCGAGVDHLLRHPGLPGTLPLYRLEDAGMGTLMADYCLHQLLRIAGRHDDYARQQVEGRWLELDPLAREDMPVGILGLGVLGEAVARRLADNGFIVRAHARSPRTLPGIEVSHGAATLNGFLAATRVLILLLPLTPETTDLIDAQALAALQPGAFLINIARGALVVDADLLAALDRGQLAGATLDVFRHEPLPATHPFWHHPRVRITPHVSGPTQVGASAEQVAGKLALLARSGTPSGLVHRDRGY